MPFYSHCFIIFPARTVAPGSPRLPDSADASCMAALRKHPEGVPSRGMPGTDSTAAKVVPQIIQYLNLQFSLYEYIFAKPD